jgi:P4 family phage/plasmid primase-like protien
VTAAERSPFPAAPADNDGVPQDWTELGLGEALAGHLVGRWVYDVDAERWHQWDGRRWAAQPVDVVHAEAQRWWTDVGQAVVARPGDVGGLLRQYATFRKVSPLERVVTSARRRLHVRSVDFDRHPHLLNVANGVVDLRTGELQPSDPDLLLSKVAGCDYVEGASHDDVVELLGCVDLDVADSLQMFFGAAASGCPTDDVAILDGGGSNGKTVLLSAVATALGDHATAVAPELVVQGDNGPPGVVWVAELKGARLAYVEELAEDGRLRLERVKAITGGGHLVGARKYGHPFTFSPTHTLVVASNHRPNVNSAEHAAWRRLRLVPFPYRYVPAGDVGRRPGDREADVGLRERLRHLDRLEAVLSWVVDGAVFAYERGDLVRPVVDWCATVLDATRAWRDAEDVIGRFIAERVTITGDPNDDVAGLELFDAYARWCEDERRAPGQAKTFYGRWTSHDDVAGKVDSYTRQGSRRFRGAQLRSPIWPGR